MNEIIFDEGLELKDRLKEKRDQNNISNQEIADISGLSVHTVNNYFSARSKASSAYTVGKICMALRVSFDKAFSIVPDHDTEELSRIAELEQRCKEYETKVAHKQELIAMQENTIRSLQDEARRRRPLVWALVAIIAFLAILFAIYFVYFDLSNPNFGIYRK